MPSDTGIFGPASVTWRIHGEPLALVGGLRALLLQALHPEAMALLYAKSAFQDDAWSRLQRTAGYVATVTFAPTSEAEAAAAHVRGVHQRLGITDPAQLAWVHACEVDSFLVAARAAGIRLSRTDTDRYVEEQVRAAAMVGVPDELTPRSVGALGAYFAAMRPALAGTKEAREAARYVFAPPMPVPGRYVLPARLGWTTISSLAVGLLPGWARRMYRLPPAPGAGLATAAGMRALRRAVGRLPVRYREGPLYRDAKARVAALS
ncbi:MAG: oxygenase MpaB family protein [Pseudonocardiales bacterium]|nr:DUF2236 domain-containing protein [Actinomycetota bacterium]